MESNTMDHSLNSARQSLRVGKIRLYNYLDELGIEPTLNGNSKLITDEQLEEIRTAIQAEALSQQNPEDNLQNRIKRQKTVPEDIQDNPKTASQNNLNNGTIYSNLRDEITHLRKLLESEQQERQEKDKRHDEVLKEFNQSTERFQAMLMQLQTKNNELSQKLLEAPKGKEEVTVSRDAFKDTEREVVDNSQNVLPVTEQPVQPQSRFFTPAIWAAAAVVLTISVVEFGGFSISSLVRDLLALR